MRQAHAPDEPCSVPRRPHLTPLFAGIDIGGTNIKIGLVDGDNVTIAYRSIATEQERGPADAAGRIGAMTSILSERRLD
jgi:predicted NBD/HSP70 family sugar kinase